MAANMGTTTTINDLNNECLRKILLNIQVYERLTLREVCKQWRKAIDDGWRQVRKVVILDAICMNDSFDDLEMDDSFDDSSDDLSDICGILENVSGIHHTVCMMAKDQKLIQWVMKRCGDVINKLVEARRGENNSSLPMAIKYCSNIEDFTAFLDTKVDDKNAGRLFALNKNLRRLNLGIKFQHTRMCFRKIPTDNLESLNFRVMDCPNPSSSILVGQKQFIGRCSSLKQVVVNYFDDELVKLIGQKITLERLGLSFHYCNGATPGVLNHILTMKNLRELSLNPADASESGLKRSLPFVTDDFLEALVENLPLLKWIQLLNPANLTNKGFKSLAALEKLKNLTIRDCPGITDEYLFLFSGLEELDLKDCPIRDAGVIRFLEEAKTLRELNLENSLITNDTLIAADKATKKRENGIRLTLYAIGTPTTPITLTETSLLKIMCNDDDYGWGCGGREDCDDDDFDIGCYF